MNELALANAAIEPVSKGMSQALAHCQALTISSQTDYSNAVDLVKSCKAEWASLESRRTAITQPINQGLRLVNDLFREPLAGLAKCESIIKNKMASYDAAQQAERVRIMRESAALHAAGGVPTEAIPERPEAPGVAMRNVWKFVIEQPEIVPKEFWSPDPAKIAATIAHVETSPHPIQGVRFYQESIVRVGK